jgi:2-oxoglutarate dehydrogenase E1 component
MTAPGHNPATTPASTRSASTAVNGWQAEYLEAQYLQYKTDPSSVTADVAAFFAGFDLAQGGGGPAGGASAAQQAADALITAYRAGGHEAARTDPFGREPRRPAALDPKTYGVTEAMLGATVDGRSVGLGGAVTLRDLVGHLQKVYCGPIGVEFAHVTDPVQREWFRSRFETGGAIPAFSVEERALILEQITAAEVFDRFLGKRYQGKKRFSLEGGEALIPLLRWLTQRAGELGTEEIIIGMPHRGRLSVLRNWIGKDLEKLFTEFEDSWSDGEDMTAGDVKYHRGYSGDQALKAGGSVHLSLLNNPSHLESVNGLVMGRTRAKQDQTGDTDRRRVISVLMHGDAALAGQGVVAECLNMSRLEGYTCGGTIHVAINNLVGFTTDPEDGRSTAYCTDIAKFIGAPVLHVNGDDPEACAAAAMMAAEYRHEFRQDVFIDLVCFRRYGHNEQDEPGYTQPQLYTHVRAHPGPGETYRQRLVEAGVIDQARAQAMVDAVTNDLDKAQTAARQTPVNPVPPPGSGLWKGFGGRYSFESPATAVKPEVIALVCEAMGRAPEGFTVHPKLKGLLASRAGLPRSGALSHADAEQIAIGTLLLEGYGARLSGQDARRGTFTQRHAVLRDEATGERYTPLNHIATGKQARFDVWDSPLSEYSVMGFDYGYSRGAPGCLVMWEGQFGDFCNTAQVIIDQYIASSEVKWSRWAGLVLLLPHGYEGQGPEHSSARLERFLSLCADENMEVVYPSTGAQVFHMLRRQMLRKFRKPLVVMTPKKYLRFESSNIAELSQGGFRHLIDDTVKPAGVSRVIYCSGKIYHELHERRTALGRDDVAIVRVEQLYPFHTAMAKEIDGRYPRSAKRLWVQEEPRNAGAYIYAADVFRTGLGVELEYVGRPASASPAGASEHRHKDHQERILAGAVGPLPQAAPTNGKHNGQTEAAGAHKPKAAKR